jgi:malonyl CoA-acyl carrier protein transacylase
MFADLLVQEEIFQQVFALADQVAGFHDLMAISLYLSKPSALPTKKSPVYRNTALFCTQVAMGRMLIARGLAPDIITGHSFGECAGLVLAGLVSFEEMLPIVIHRNLICPPANELGGMVTVSASREKLLSLLEEEGVYLANINSHKQIVLSLKASRQTFALDWLRAQRIPHLFLTELPQPYHSPLMEPYRQQLAITLKRLPLTVHAPGVPFFSGIEHCWINLDNYQSIDMRALLARQFTEPVFFVEQLEALAKLGAGAFYEVGPGKMLEPAIRNVIPFNDLIYRDMESHLPLLLDGRRAIRAGEATKSPWFNKIRQIIMSVTGYAESDIRAEDSFQNDLGIDSLRKAEILVRLINEQGLATNSDFSITRFSHIHEAVEYLESYSEERDPLMDVHAPAINWYAPEWFETSRLQFAKGHPLAQEFTHLEIELANFSWLKIIAAMEENAQSKLRLHVVLKANALIGHWPEQLLNDYAQVVERLVPDLLHITVLTKPSQRAELAPVSSFLKSVAKETRTFSVGLVEIDEVDAIAPTKILEEALSTFVKDIRLSGSKRFVRRLTPLECTGPSSQVRHVIALGGSKGIGLEVLKRFPHAHESKLLLIGRSSPDDEAIRTSLKDLRSLWGSFQYVMSDAQNVAAHLTEIEHFFQAQTIDLLINAAGTEVSQGLNERSLKSIHEEISGKLTPFHAAEELAQKLNVSKVFHFTSVVAMFGNKGQSVYAWSNRWIEEHLTPRSHALAWAPWESVGMTANPGLLQKIREWGISLVTPELGADLFWQLAHETSSLPPVLYPIDPKDSLLFSTEQYARSALGQLTNSFEAVFYRDVYLSEEPYLKDHVLLGQPLLPAAYFLSQLLNLARAQFGHMVAIRDFEMQNALMFQDGHCAYKLQCFHRAPFEFKAYSLMTNAVGRFDPELRLAAGTRSVSQRERSIDLSSFYVSDGVGGHFHFAKRAYADESGHVRLELDLSTLPVLKGERNFDMWLALIDVAFQSLSLQLKVIDGGSIIPLGLATLAFVDRPVMTENLCLVPHIRSRAGKSGSADVQFFNSHNELVFAISGIGFKTHYFDNLPPTRYGAWS